MKVGSALAALKNKTKQIKLETYTLYFAYRDSRVAWPAKLVALCVVAYAFSPVDLIPDFIPILGYLDDLILIPLGVMLAIRLIPHDVLADSRAKAQAILGKAKPKNWWAAGIIIAIWLVVSGWAAYQLYRWFAPR